MSDDRGFFGLKIISQFMSYLAWVPWFNRSLELADGSDLASKRWIQAGI
jgi:hypothetical protein